MHHVQSLRWEFIKENKKVRKKELDQERDQEKRKQELDQESDQEKKKVFSFILKRERVFFFFSWPLSFFFYFS